MCWVKEVQHTPCLHWSKEIETDCAGATLNHQGSLRPCHNTEILGMANSTEYCLRCKSHQKKIELRRDNTQTKPFISLPPKLVRTVSYTSCGSGASTPVDSKTRSMAIMVDRQEEKEWNRRMGTIIENALTHEPEAVSPVSSTSSRRTSAASIFSRTTFTRTFSRSSIATDITNPSAYTTSGTNSTAYSDLDGPTLAPPTPTGTGTGTEQSDPLGKFRRRSRALSKLRFF
jgi:hypothetical protein